MFLLIFLAVAFIAITALVENFYGTIATVVVVAAICIAHFAIVPFIPSAWEWIKTNPFLLAGLVIAYAAIGSVWSFNKWFWYLEDKQFHNTYTAQEIASHNKDKIALWIGYWPSSLLWACLKNPFTYLGKTLTRWFNNVYVGMVQKRLDKIAASRAVVTVKK